MRVLYVAATRAEDRLIFSGAIDRKGLENLAQTDRELWLAWIWHTLGLAEQAHRAVLTCSDDVQIQVTIDRETQTTTAPATSLRELAEAQVIDTSRPLEEIFPLLKPIGAQRGGLLRRFTVTQLLNFQRCARQYYFERMLRTPGKEERAVWNDAEAPEPPANLTATLKGAVIHRFCEMFREGDDVEARLTASFDEIKSQRQAELVGRAFEIDEVEAVRALMPLAQNYLSSEVFRRIVTAERVDSKFQIPNSKSSAGLPQSSAGLPQSSAGLPQSSAGLWSELRFRLRRPLGILTGTLDKLLITPGSDGKGVDVEIIDFKTNRFAAPAAKAVRPRRTAAQAGSSNSRTVTPTGQGDVRIFPGGSPAPLVSTTNWRAGQTRANNAIVLLGPTGDITVHPDQATGTIHFIIDVNGYFE